MNASLAQSNLHQDLIEPTILQKGSTIQFDLIVLTCPGFSLLSILIGSRFVATIAIVLGDPDGGDEDDQDVVRRVARQLLRREIASRYRTLDTGDTQESTEASDEVRLNQIDHSTPFPPWSGSGVLW